MCSIVSLSVMPINTCVCSVSLSASLKVVLRHSFINLLIHLLLQLGSVAYVTAVPLLLYDKARTVQVSFSEWRSWNIRALSAAQW